MSTRTFVTVKPCGALDYFLPTTGGSGSMAECGRGGAVEVGALLLIGALGGLLTAVSMQVRSLRADLVELDMFRCLAADLAARRRDGEGP